MLNNYAEVAVFSNSAVLNEGVKSLINQHKKVVIVGMTTTKEEVFSTLSSYEPDIFILASLDKDVLTTIKKQSSDTSIIACQDYNQPKFSALVSSFFSLSSLNSLQETLNIWVQELINSPKVSFEIKGNFKFINKINQSQLTESEKKVLTLLCSGYRTVQIANKLNLKEATIKGKISNILSKLNVEDRGQAIVCAFRGGLVIDELY
jgi:DNA-binding NarL/FixJ family response regulator